MFVKNRETAPVLRMKGEIVLHREDIIKTLRENHILPPEVEDKHVMVCFQVPATRNYCGDKLDILNNLVVNWNVDIPNPTT